MRNLQFILNSILSDVVSSVKKEPINLNVMDFKQMFDSEKLSTCLNALYEAEIQDDMLALIYEANKTTFFAVKTPNGITEKTTVTNKLDGVGPVDNRPSTNKLHHFVQKKINK